MTFSERHVLALLGTDCQFLIIFLTNGYMQFTLHKSRYVFGKHFISVENAALPKNVAKDRILNTY